MGEPIRPTNKTDLSTCLPFERPAAFTDVAAESTAAGSQTSARTPTPPPTTAVTAAKRFAGVARSRRVASA